MSLQGQLSVWELESRKTTAKQELAKSGVHLLAFPPTPQPTLAGASPGFQTPGVAYSPSTLKR